MALINCPECGNQISDTVYTCIHCGYPLKEEETQDRKQVKNIVNKKIIIPIVIAIILFILAFVYFKFMWRGTFEITQSNDTIELGSYVNLVNYLEYNPEKIIEVNIVSDDNYSSSKLGDYTVVFSVKNDRGKVEEITYDFHVVDTVAPKITISKDTIYIPKGGSFEPKSYVTAQDKDEYTIDIAGTYDINAEGTYDINVTAKDKSGNVSETKSMKLIVENRDDCVVRNVKFGDSAEVIKRYETGTFFAEEKETDGSNYIVYTDVVEGEDADIYYTLNKNDELYSIMYAFHNNHTDYSLYINAFNKISEKLEVKYGEANAEKAKGSLYSYSDSEGDALMLGQVKYRNTWETDDMSIVLYLGNDNYEVSFALLFQSKVIDESEVSEF